jgi:hypothetical protein
MKQDSSISSTPAARTPTSSVAPPLPVDYISREDYRASIDQVCRWPATWCPGRAVMAAFTSHERLTVDVTVKRALESRSRRSHAIRPGFRVAVSDWAIYGSSRIIACILQESDRSDSRLGNCVPLIGIAYLDETC